MRPEKEPGFSPLSDKQKRKMLKEHIPYRLQLLNDAFNRVPARTWQDNQAFEAGAAAGRILLSFLGVGYSEKIDDLKQERRHKLTSGLTDDVKVRDLGGRFVDLNELLPEEKRILADFIRGVHKTCAHFTIDSAHNMTVMTYKKAVPIITKLLHHCLPTGKS